MARPTATPGNRKTRGLISALPGQTASGSASNILPFPYGTGAFFALFKEVKRLADGATADVLV